MNDEPTVSIRIDDRLDEYRPFFDHDWAARIDRLAGRTKLAEPVFKLSVNWRAAANACAMPWLVCRASQSLWSKFLGRQQPFSERVTGAMAQRLAEEMSDSLSRAKQRKLNDAIERIGREVHQQAEEAIHVDAQTLWKGLMTEPEFQLAIWGSLRLGYGSIYHSYEHFLRECIALAVDNPGYKGRRIHALVRDARRLFGPKVAHDCLVSPQVMAARLVRNALAHDGGRETPQLKSVAHGLTVEQGVLQIMAPDTRGLFDLLAIRALKLVRRASKLPSIREPLGE
jgi:hypothetical protein